MRYQIGDPSSRNGKQFKFMSIFCASTLEMVHEQFPQHIIYHYMDDILLIASDTDTLERIFNVIQEISACWGLQVSPEKKIQRGNSLNYLGFKLSKQGIQPQKI